MYQIFVVEDEPAALKHILTLIHLKCPKFVVTGTADNGKDALEQLEVLRPDVLITDVRMPVMDGIELVQRVREKYPDILSVIISGYQEFEYAREAILAGVCDYILKPVKPSAFQDSMRKIRGKLDKAYYVKRNRILQSMSRGHTEIIDKKEFLRVFPEEQYYVALFRKNSLPQRFVNAGGTEVFSMPEEQIVVYGRDDRETLYICPKDLMVYGSFCELMQKIVEKEKNLFSYYTLVLEQTCISPKELPATIQRLYHILDSCLIIGKNTTVILEKGENWQKKIREEKDSLEYLQHLLKEGNRRKALEETEHCLTEWLEKEYTQLVVEDKVREIFRIFRKFHMLEESVEACGYYIDEVFYYAEDTKSLVENILRLLDKSSEVESRKIKIDSKAYFEGIMIYMSENLSEPLSLQVLCQHFGVSQAYLCRLFRNYASKSFSKMLNELRIEKACEIMRNRRGLFIKDIAALVGYTDQFYFSRIFRSITGVSPSEYMEDLNEGTDGQCRYDGEEE